MAEKKFSGKALDQPIIFLLVIWFGVVSVTALMVWFLSSTGFMPGMLKLIVPQPQSRKGSCA